MRSLLSPSIEVLRDELNGDSLKGRSDTAKYVIDTLMSTHKTDALSAASQKPTNVMVQINNAAAAEHAAEITARSQIDGSGIIDAEVLTEVPITPSPAAVSLNTPLPLPSDAVQDSPPNIPPVEAETFDVSIDYDLYSLMKSVSPSPTSEQTSKLT